MSTAIARPLAPALPLAPAPSRSPRLEVLDSPARRRRPRVVYAIVAIAGVVAIGAAQMGLSIVMTQGGYEEKTLRQEQRALQWESQSLTEELAGLSSPQYLAANASALGMVIEESPTYLRLSDAAILGVGEMASGASAIDALGRGSVPNALVADAPLVTEPDATIMGVPVAEIDPLGANGTGLTVLPPALSEGLPSPMTH